jgi:hypothetical protein
MPIGTRTTVVRLASGGLGVHSPGPLGDGVRDAIEKRGRVAALVAPNCFHHLFLSENAAAWPDAKIFLAPGLHAKLGDLPTAKTLGETAPEAWSGVLDQLLIAGAPRMGEVAFLHRASRTLLLTDLVFNIRARPSGLARWIMAANGMVGHFGPSRVARTLFFRDRRALRTSVDRILGWDFDRVILSHGEVVESGGRSLLEEAFASLRA